MGAGCRQTFNVAVNDIGTVGNCCMEISPLSDDYLGYGAFTLSSRTYVVKTKKRDFFLFHIFLKFLSNSLTHWTFISLVTEVKKMYHNRKKCVLFFK